MVERRQVLYIAADGWPFVLAAAAALVAALVLSWWLPAVATGVFVVLLVLLFRDPPRRIPAQPMAVVSPVDGRVTAIEVLEQGVLKRPALRMQLRIDNLGAYAARSPIEGRVMELTAQRLSRHGRMLRVRGLWVRSDSGHDVVLLIHSLPLLGHPRAFVGYGERVGQGQPAAWLRISREAEVFVPANARARVAVGDHVLAGQSVLADLPHAD